MDAGLIEKLLPVARALSVAGHGQKGPIKARACAELGISLQTLHRWLDDVRPKPVRKRRDDAGVYSVTRDEALLVSGVVQKATRQHGKRGYSITDAVADLRSAGLLAAGKLDKDTGELVPVSDSAVIRAMKHYGVHPDQLNAPAPHTTMASKHPNHVWQIDASICVLYYLKPKAGGANGLRVMAHDKFYKNKPKNVEKIAANRVWSYEITDHTSGWVFVTYVMGAESGENFCRALIMAMQERGEGDILHGVPRILYADPGSANISSMVRNLCKHLGIQFIAHAPGNARATGQVEQARDLIERKFEAGLRFQPVADLDELNAHAAQWRIKFNATARHSRHGKTRSAVWMAIRQEQLIKAPDEATCWALATSAPKPRKVKPTLRVPLDGVEYDVSQVPGIRVGDKVPVTLNIRKPGTAQVILADAEGNDVIHVVPEVAKSEFGFPEAAPVYGENFKQPPSTDAQAVQAEIDALMMGDKPEKDAIPLGGRFNPLTINIDAQIPTYLPKRGTEHALTTPKVEALRLTPVQIAKRLHARFGDSWKPEFFAWISQRYPEGAPEDQLDTISEALQRQGGGALRLVNGGDA